MIIDDVRDVPTSDFVRDVPTSDFVRDNLIRKKNMFMDMTDMLFPRIRDMVIDAVIGPQYIEDLKDFRFPSDNERIIFDEDDVTNELSPSIVIEELSDTE